MNKLTLYAIITAETMMILILVAINVFASVSFPKTICHHTPGNNVTLTFQNQQSYSGHLGTPHNNQTFDTNGPCVVPSPSPTVVPTASPSATPTPSPSGTPEPSATPEPSSTPEPERTPEPQVSQGTTGTAEFAPDPAPICVDIEHAPTITGVERLSSTSVKVWWSETAPVSDYVVDFGLTEHSLIWSTVVLNSHEVVLNDLPKDRFIWVRVRATQNGCVGPTSIVVDP